jgi:hypothetical protein
MHEWVHMLARQFPDEYKGLHEFLKKKSGKLLAFAKVQYGTQFANAGIADLGNQLAKKSAAAEEGVARAVELVMKSPEMLQALEREQPGIIQRLINFLQGLLARLAGVEPGTAEARAKVLDLVKEVAPEVEKRIRAEIASNKPPRRGTLTGEGNANRPDTTSSGQPMDGPGEPPAPPAGPGPEGDQGDAGSGIRPTVGGPRGGGSGQSSGSGARPAAGRADEPGTPPVAEPADETPPSDSGSAGSGEGGGLGGGNGGLTPPAPPILEPEPPRELTPEERNHVLTPGQALAPRTPKQKWDANIAAIELLRKLESDNRNATPEEKAVLARYSGWGWAGEYFNRDNDRYTKQYNQLKKLLSDEEFRRAAASTTNAHYTSHEVITAMWQGLERMGFK